MNQHHVCPVDRINEIQCKQLLGICICRRVQDLPGYSSENTPASPSSPGQPSLSEAFPSEWKQIQTGPSRPSYNRSELALYASKQIKHCIAEKQSTKYS